MYCAWQTFFITFYRSLKIIEVGCGEYLPKRIGVGRGGGGGAGDQAPPIIRPVLDQPTLMANAYPSQYFRTSWYYQLGGVFSTVFQSYKDKG